MNKKTNIDYLRKILDTFGNLMGENNYVESIEWLDAIQSELDVANEKVEVLGKNVEQYKKEASDWEDDYQECNQKLTECQDTQPVGLIRAGTGDIRWEADNIQLQGLMEVLEEKIKRHTPLKIENILTAL